MAQCPECNSRLVIAADLELWDRLYCDLCGAELEIVNEHPIELEAVFDFDDETDLLGVLDAPELMDDWDEAEEKDAEEEEWDDELAEEDW